MVGPWARSEDGAVPGEGFDLKHEVGARNERLYVNPQVVTA